MKMTATIVLILTCYYSCMGQKDYGFVRINPELNYEVYDHYYRYDNFQNIRYADLLLEPAISVEQFDNYLIIENCFNMGLGGDRVRIKISKDLKILDAVYSAWTDYIDGSVTIYSVEDITLSLNANPFDNLHFEGRYEIKIKQDFKAGKYLASDGIRDTIIIKDFFGKFKIYTDNELALKKHRLDSLNASMENRRNKKPVVTNKLDTTNLKITIKKK